MQKTAQKRNFFNKLRESVNISGKAAENFFNPQFKKVMTTLRIVDNNIRSIVTGEEIGSEEAMDGSVVTGSPGSDPGISMKELLKSSRSNINKLEYMRAVADLGRFHKKMMEINQELQKLQFEIDDVHHQFLFGKPDDDTPVLSDEQRQHLHDLKTRFAHYQRMELIKEAGIMDFFYHLTERGRALKFWEKRFPKQVGKLKKDTQALQNKSEAVLNQIISLLKDMAQARSVRNLDAYEKAANKMSAIYKSYHSFFEKYYNDNVKGFLEKVELIAPTKSIDKETKEMGSQEVATKEKSTKEESAETKSSRPESSMNQAPEDILPAPGKLPNLQPPTLRDSTPPIHMDSERPSSSIPFPLVKDKAKTQSPSAAPDTLTMYSPNTLRSPDLSSGVAPSPSKVPSTLPPTSSNPSTSTPDELAELGGERAAEVLRQMQSGKKSHHSFWNTLNKMSNENPLILAGFIKRYATSIQSDDPETAVQLMKIVKRIKG